MITQANPHAPRTARGMKGKVIAVANMKGGVGKTATVVGLAEALAAEGAEMLVVDLDSQANASICLAGDEVLKTLIEDGNTIDAFLDDRFFRDRRDASIASRIRTNVSNVFHLERSITALAAGIELGAAPAGTATCVRTDQDGHEPRPYRRGAARRHQGSAERDPRRSYDYILFDCAPGISALTEVSLRLADLVDRTDHPRFPVDLWAAFLLQQSVERSDRRQGTTLKKPEAAASS